MSSGCKLRKLFVTVGYFHFIFVGLEIVLPNFFSTLFVVSRGLLLLQNLQSLTVHHKIQAADDILLNISQADEYILLSICPAAASVSYTLVKQLMMLF
jgi:hypothetical protein